MSTISLVKSAFGCKATLYTVLNCKKTSSQSELRSAYRKAALQFHPDRANASNNDNNGDTTLKFQAVSAAYQVLMDEQQRSAYDATGRVLEEHYDDDPFGSSSDNDEGNQQQHYAPRGKRQRPRDQKQQQWEDFFHSIFNEIISTGCTHEENAKLYPGSPQECDDVLRCYTMCKGNMQKVLECIVHATQDDIGRWRKYIIDPAILRGEVDDFFNVNATKKVMPSKVSKKRQTIMTLEDSSSSDDDAVSTAKRKCSSSRPKRLKRGKCDISKNTLVDTDDDEPEDYNAGKSKARSAAMSMREKMDYRVARKRKIKAEKEMEIAKIVQSKDWDSNHFYGKQPTKKNGGGVSDQLLSQIEHKYATKTISERRRKR